MAIEKVIKISGDTSDAQKGLDSLVGSVDNLNKGIDETGEKSKKANKKVEDSSKKATKGIKGMAGGFKAVGTAFKAIGIGLVIALVAKLTEVFSKNQKVVDAFSVVMTTLEILFNDVFRIVGDLHTKIKDATGGFDAMGKVISGLITIALTPLKAGFYAIVLAVQKAQLVWEKSFFGDNDSTTIKELNKSIAETELNLLEVADAAIDAGKKVASNISEAVSEVTDAVKIISKDGIEAVKNISVDAAIEQAKAITQATNGFERLALTQARLMLQYQNEAEILRQTRDDVTASIDDRIAANDKLAGVLNKQFTAEQESIKQRIASLQQEQNLLGVTVERSNEIYQLQTDLIDVEERLQGQRSEQLVNSNGLLLEQIDLNLTISDSEKQRELDQISYAESQEIRELDKLEKQKERLVLENEIIIEDLERKKELYKEGTQARVDAEQDFLNKKQVIDNQLDANKKAADKQKIKDDEIVGKTKINLASKTFSTIGLLTEENSKLGKATAVAAALTNTYQGITTELATKTVTPFEFGLKLANIATTTTIGFKAVKDILKTNVGSTSAPSGGSVGQAAPSFNIVKGTGTNQIAEGLDKQDQPIKAFVVSSDVTTSQSLDRNIVENSSL